MNWTSKQRLIIYTLLIAAVAFAMAVLDVPVSTWVYEHERPAAVRRALQIIRLPGLFGFTVALALLLACCRLCRWRAAGMLLLCGAASCGVTALAKLVFGRLRPFKGRAPFDWSPFAAWPWDGVGSRNLSFPSGDATLAFATAAALTVVYPKWRTPAWIWATCVAITRVLQGAHYPADVTFAAVVAIGVTDLLMTLDRRMQASQPLVPPTAV